jgi:hypothetical protein
MRNGNVKLTAKQLRRILEEVPDDDTRIVITIRDKSGDVLQYGYAEDAYYDKPSDVLHIEGVAQ